MADYNKAKLEEIVNDAISDSSFEKKIEIIDEMKKHLETILAKNEENYRYCPFCKKYSEKENFTIEKANVVLNEIIYIDAGYGDTDTHGDVLYYATLSVCPKCGEKHILNKQQLEVLNEYDKYGHRIR